MIDIIRKMTASCWVIFFICFCMSLIVKDDTAIDKASALIGGASLIAAVPLSGVLMLLLIWTECDGNDI